MPDIWRRAQARIDELLRQSVDPSLAFVGVDVLDEAKRGLRNPSLLSDIEIKRVCYAVVAYHSGRKAAGLP